MFLYSRCAAYETQYSSRKWERNGISLSNCLFLEMNSYQLSFLTMRNELSSPSLKLMGSVEKEKEILRWQIFYSGRIRFAMAYQRGMCQISFTIKGNIMNAWSLGKYYVLAHRTPVPGMIPTAS